MAKYSWTDQFNVGIEAIDSQHRRIVDYINLLDDANTGRGSREEIGKLIDAVVDYTISHFAFEEGLLSDAGYPFLKVHHKVHVLFAKRIADLQAQFNSGDDVTENLSSMLVTWLLNHIQHEDADFVETVKKYLLEQPDYHEEKKKTFGNLFR